MFGKKTKTSGSGLTYISADCRLKGDLVLESDCMVDGTIEGTVTAKGSVIIEQQGRVEGELEATEVRVSGHFKGKLKCSKLSITANGMVDGEVLSEKIEIFEGGQFIGTRLKEEVLRLDKPKADEVKADEPKLTEVKSA
ncbi:polymer-forming cytoskeletal protein [Ferrimonas balearica]|uniref:bactofilin family protein n=1 Tax=Ferrimonas balearica TaxID=44012 RepID=UPI001C998BB1|nr:polymer-forming cytoskeletal protein [Ferrimonas balearica]MBY5921213.1 polymer-forming cytoskeletal protein [Ferrimonas balearica]MBY5996102.1 polymer-forming cytoskeletal protein [Ferrimonas balearica]